MEGIPTEPLLDPESEESVASSSSASLSSDILVPSRCRFLWFNAKVRFNVSGELLALVWLLV